MPARRLGNHFCDTRRRGWIGRRLPAIFKRSGLTEVSVTPITLVVTDYGTAVEVLYLRDTIARAKRAGIVSEIEAARWLGGLAGAAQAEEFFCAVTVFIVAGCMAFDS